MGETTVNANPTDSFLRHHATWTSDLSRHSHSYNETATSDGGAEPTHTDFAMKHEGEIQQMCFLKQTCLPKILFCFSL